MPGLIYSRQLRWLLLVVCFCFPVKCDSAAGNCEQAKIRHIAVIVFAAPFLKSYSGLRSGLQQLGYKLDKELIFSVYSVERDPSKVAPLIKKCAAAHFDLVYTVTTQVTQAVKVCMQKNRIDIPVVFTAVADPVSSNIVTNLRHPDANITGVSHVSRELLPQRLLLFKKAFPQIKRPAVFFDPEDGVAKNALDQPCMQYLTHDLGIAVVARPAGSLAAMQRSCKQLRRTDIDSIFMLPDALSVACFDEFLQLSRHLRIPLMVIDNILLKQGGVMGYSPDFYAVGVQAAALVDQIFKGVAPGDIAVQNPEKVNLVVSLREVRALNLHISDDILLQADEVLR
jgi:putative ABC transport system substrate-binding protein